MYLGRHAVYVDELRAMPPSPDGMVRDAFDDLPDTMNLVVDWHGRVAGGARYVADRGRGTTADAYFDFTPFLPPGALKGAGSMLWMLPEVRGQRGLLNALLAAGHAWCIEQRLTHVLAAVNPPVAPVLARAGYRALGEPFVDAHAGLPVQPMVLEIGEALRQAA